ncbi:hypothetical protein DYB32_003321 [Aphanomyces invadans]|uniref:Uncharacterized protein n=1 Tax=Aphanomyces invadans TaxID=157072 RepID=A0A3R6ZSN7_9STRA|nr:hypothetical protein DYB32_003321 [Aphanomyces invadans]
MHTSRDEFAPLTNFPTWARSERQTGDESVTMVKGDVCCRRGIQLCKSCIFKYIVSGVSNQCPICQLEFGTYPLSGTKTKPPQIVQDHVMEGLVSDLKICLRKFLSKKNVVMELGEIQIRCEDKTLGKEHSLEFIQRTIWHPKKAPILMEYRRVDATSKTLDTYGVISGCFVCLTEMLDATTYDKSKRDALFQFMHVTLATAASGNLSRLAIVKSCLGLLSKRMDIFADNIMDANPYEFYSLMLYCCSSSNKKIRKPAFACLDAMFSVIAHGLVADVPTHKKTFNRFLKEFLSCVTDKLADDKASVALAGLGNFASIVPAFLTNDALAKICTRLIKYGEDLMAVRDGKRVKWMLLCRYTTCFARFIQKRHDSVVQNFAVELVGRILDAYPASAIYVKYQAEVAFVAIAESFYSDSAADVLKRIVQHGMFLTVSTRVNPSESDMMFHPETGLPESRLLFEYEVLWRGCFMRMHDPALQQRFVNAMADVTLSILDRLDLRYELKIDRANDLTSASEYAVRPIPLYLQQILSKARALPLVSAFYRLATVMSRMLSAAPSLPDPLAEDFIQFVVDVSNAMQQYHDELLIATSLFVLAAPTTMVDISTIVPALKQALILGVSHHTTAVAAIEALDLWRVNQPDMLAPLYPDLLPLVAPYLDATNQSASFQIQVLRLLGSLGGYCRYVVQETSPDIAIPAPLNFPLAVDSVHVDISIEPLLYQMKDLAATSIDRTVKSAAGEAYHAIVLYLCGKTATLPRSKAQATEKSIYFDHWHLVFPSLLQLAADADTIIRSLFAPLLAQLLRWFSGVATQYPFEAQAFLDALIDGLSRVDSGGVRDLAAQSITTFLKYASKQPESTCFSAHSLFERLFGLCSHPSLPCRLGVGMAINNMYREFREDDELVNVYALSIAKYLLVALKPEEPNAIAVLPLVQALGHLEKIVMKRAPDLQHDNDARIELGGPECLNLDKFTTWLFANIASSAPTFRSQCLHLFVQFSRMVNRTGSCREWLKQFQKNHSVSQLQDIFAPHHLTSLAFESDMCQMWYNTIAASTECIVWACAPTIGNAGLIGDAVLFDSGARTGKRTHDDDPIDGCHRVLVAAKHFVECSNDSLSLARNRAFLGVCKLVTLAMDDPVAVPMLHHQVMASNVLSERFFDLVVLARLDPTVVHFLELSAPDASDTWLRVCKALLQHSQLPLRTVVAKHLMDNPVYDRALLFFMDSDLAQRLCTTYQLTAIALGWDIVAFILQPTPDQYALFSATFDKAIKDNDEIWLRVVRGLLDHIRTHHGFVHTLRYVLDLSPKRGHDAALAPCIGPFAAFVLNATAAAEQALLLKTLLHLLQTMRDPSTVSLAECAWGIKRLLCDNATSTSVAVKVAALELIPVLLQVDAAEFGPPLEDAVSHVVVHDFPVTSSDVAVGSLDFEKFALLFQTYLAMLAQSGHIGLLKTLFRSLNEKSRHAFFAKINAMFEAFCEDVPVPRISSVCMDIVAILFSLSQTDHVRTTLLRQLFVPLVHRMDEPAVVALYTSTYSRIPVVQYVMTVVTSEASPTQFVVTAFGMLELLYNCIAGDTIRQAVNPVYAGAPAKGNELTMRLCKAASQKCSSADRPVAMAAFRCLLTTVRKTQTQEKFYTQLLFADAIWPNIMLGDEDARHEYSFDAETAAFPTRYLSTTSRRHSRLSPLFKRIDISTQFLEGSSLSQSVAPLDDNHNGGDDDSLGSAPVDSTEADDDDALELDVLNSHPCMLPLMQTIKHMERLFQPQWTSTAMPGWMDKVWFNLTTHSSTAVRLFLCKVVLNRPALFAPFAAKFVSPLIELTLVVPKLDEFHYLLRDVCHLLLDTWSLDSVADDLSRFVNHLICVAPSTSTVILRDNLYLIEAFVTRFPSQCRFLDMDIVVGMVSTEGEALPDTSRHVAGMQITAMLVNLAFDAAAPVSWFEYSLRNASSKLESAVLARVSSSHKSTPQLAADLAGLVLKHMHSTSFESRLDAQLHEFFQLDKPDRFLVSLKQVAIHYPAIVTGSVVNRLVSILPRILIQDTLSLHFLDIFFACDIDATTLFRLLRVHMPRLLIHNNPAVTGRLLDVLAKLWPSLAPDLQLTLLEGDCAVTIAFESDACQMKVLDFLLATDKADVPSVHRILLKALTDTNGTIRDKAGAFWEKHLPQSCDHRLLALFEQLYHCDTTEEWVRYAPTLWLALGASTPDNSSLLFSTPLSATCHFDSVQIDTSWERRTQNILTPLFSQDAMALQSQQQLVPGLSERALRHVNFTTQFVWYCASFLTAHTHDFMIAGAVPPRVRFYKRASTTSNDSTSDDASRTKSFFQDRASRTKRHELARLQQEKSKGETVSLFRAYRVGELPDIQIPRMDFVRPLLVVASLHSATAIALFSAMLAAVLPTLPSETQAQVFNQLESLLQLSHGNTLFVAALHQAYITLLRQHPSTLLLAPDIVGTSSISSRNLASGQRILEEILIKSSDAQVAALAWNQLYHILQAVQNEPYLLALANDQSKVPEATMAVEAQLQGDLIAALQYYNDAEAKYAALVTDDDHHGMSILERQRWKSEQFHCLAKLNRWDSLLQDVDPDQLWHHHEPFQEKHMGYFLQACLATHNTSMLASFVNSTLQNQPHDKLQYLMTRFPDLMASTYIQLDQQSQARAAVEEFYAGCLHQWTSMPASHQYRQLLRLPNMVFLDNVLAVAKQHHGAKSCVEKWKPIAPLVQEDPLDAWSMYYLIRNVGYETLVIANNQSSTQSIEDNISSIRVHTILSYAEAAVASNVLALAGRLLADYRTLCMQAHLPKLTLHMVQVYSAQVSKLASRQLQVVSTLEGDAKEKVLTQVSNYYGALNRLFDNEEVIAFIPTMPAATQTEIYGWQARALMEASAFHREFGSASLGATLETSALEIFEFQTARATAMTSMHVMYIEYLDKCIERAANDKCPSGPFAQAFVETVLWGMAQANKTCAAYFPRVLGLVRDAPAKLLPILDTRMQRVPLWTCLHWSAQIMALLDIHSSPFNDWVLNLLEKCRIDRLHHPEIRLKEALRYLTDVVDAKPKAQVATIVADTLSKLWDDPAKVLGNQIGRYNRQWMQQHRKHLEGMLGKDGQLTTTTTLHTARGWLSQTFQVVPGKYGIDRQWKAKLVDFSDWLAHLDPVKIRIELPGQYTKRWDKPDPATHSYILSCEPQLTVLPSKQLPKRIVFHSSDERTYVFLVKVVPMTTTIGLVEWLGHTTTLKTVVEEELATSTKKTNLLQSPPGQLYEGFWTKQKGKTYGHKIATAPTPAVVATLVQAQALVPSDLLRRRLVHMAKTTQAFFQLRDCFGTSLAAFNGCSYVLGIGDRHLDNFLLDQRTGAVVGIDFGISFGAGASLLPVPELVPFRYTQQLQGVLQPHDAKLLLQQDLAAVLDALRGQQQRIDSVMHVFLNEPLLEWQTQSKKKKTEQLDMTETASMWMPQMKIELARRKLRGEHAVHILIDELALNPHVAAVLKPLQSSLPAPDVLPHTILSPVDQAKALIQLATAPNILGRIFHGWSPWA